MKYIDIEDLKSGMTIAEDIFSDSGLLLANKDTILDEEIIQKLKKTSVKLVSIIEDQLDSSTPIISDEDKNKVISSIISTITNMRLFGKDCFGSIKGISLETINEIILDDDALFLLNELSKIDSYTFKHSLRVALISALIAEWQELDDQKIRKAFIAGLYHQVGKLGVERELLLSAEPLDYEELEKVRNYSLNTEKFLSNLYFVDDEIITAIVQSTEKLDGSGFPNHLHSDEICHLAKVIGVANIFDAAINDKCYKEAISPFDIAQELFDDSIEKLSPKSTLPLIKTIESSFLGMKVELSNGEVGEVVFMNKLDSRRPLVKVDDKIYDLSMGSEKLTIKRMF